MMRSVWVVTALVCSVFVGNSLSAVNLRLEPGTWSLGGNFTIPYTYDRRGTSQVSFREEPEVGYFVYRGLKLVASLEFETNLRWSRVNPVRPGVFSWGGQIGADYIFPLGGSIYLLTGLRGGVRFKNLLVHKPVGIVHIPFGIMLAMNENVAVTFGIPVELAFSQEFGFESFSLSPGYLGVSAFF
jgi:hypothetical protein